MLDIVLYQPEIPPNTGNIVRLCANTGARLHLIRPLGFDWDDRKLKRAGLDYAEWTHVTLWDRLEDFSITLGAGRRLYAVSTRGHRRYDEVSYRPEDALLFGPETRGLPAHLLREMEPQNTVRLPMQAVSRSMNLSNCVAVCVYEAWRQMGFEGGA